MQPATPISATRTRPGPKRGADIEGLELLRGHHAPRLFNGRHVQGPVGVEVSSAAAGERFFQDLKAVEARFLAFGGSPIGDVRNRLVRVADLEGVVGGTEEAAP